MNRFTLLTLAFTAPALAQSSALMPLEEYGFSRKFTWFSDRYGVSWQLNLA